MEKLIAQSHPLIAFVDGAYEKSSGLKKNMEVVLHNFNSGFLKQAIHTEAEAEARHRKPEREREIHIYIHRHKHIQGERVRERQRIRELSRTSPTCK